MEVDWVTCVFRLIPRQKMEVKSFCKAGHGPPGAQFRKLRRSMDQRLAGSDSFSLTAQPPREWGVGMSCWYDWDAETRRTKPNNSLDVGTGYG
jgi:hypothetical protein